MTRTRLGESRGAREENRDSNRKEIEKRIGCWREGEKERREWGKERERERKEWRRRSGDDYGSISDNYTAPMIEDRIRRQRV